MLCISGKSRIVYTPDAIAWTEAPETLRTLARQRFRWAYGTLQCLWKHRDKVFNLRYRALGWFSLPSVWFFQILLVALTPLVDFFLIASLPFGAWRAVMPFVITFLAMDVILATLACVLERESILTSLADYSDAADLPAASQLCDLESDSARDQGRLGRLGKTGANRICSGAGVKLPAVG